ncbi:MAG: hypothetical protein RIR83_412 [Pseudomonadota bacterium]
MELSDYIDDVVQGEDVPENPSISIVIPPSFRGQRIDKALGSLIGDYSRSKIQQWLQSGIIQSAGEALLPKYTVLGNEQISIAVPSDPQNTAYQPEDIPLQIVFSDASIAIIHKPVGLVVHPAVGNWGKTLLNAVLHHFPECSLVPRAGIVHRLDKDTSGLLVIAKNLIAQNALVKQLQERSMQRRYLALVWGKAPLIKEIDQPIGRDPHHRLKMAISSGSSSKEARTRVQCLDQITYRDKVISLVECQLETGRTHQIRVHLESIGHPLVNDPIYRSKVPIQVDQFLRADMQHNAIQIPGQILHARLLGLCHPQSLKNVSWQIDPAQAFIDLFKLLGISTASWQQLVK